MNKPLRNIRYYCSKTVCKCAMLQILLSQLNMQRQLNIFSRHDLGPLYCVCFSKDCKSVPYSLVFLYEIQLMSIVWHTNGRRARICLKTGYTKVFLYDTLCNLVGRNRRSLYLIVWIAVVYCKIYHHYQKSWAHHAAPANQEAEPGVIWAGHLRDYRRQTKRKQIHRETKDTVCLQRNMDKTSIPAYWPKCIDLI